MNCEVEKLHFYATFLRNVKLIPCRDLIVKTRLLMLTTELSVDGKVLLTYASWELFLLNVLHLPLERSECILLFYWKYVLNIRVYICMKGTAKFIALQVPSDYIVLIFYLFYCVWYTPLAKTVFEVACQCILYIFWLL